MSELDTQALLQRIGNLLGEAVKVGASDVHIRVGQPPMVRHLGELHALKFEPFTAEELQHITDRVTPPRLRELAQQRDQIDFSVEWQTTSRFRVHRFKACGEPALVLRLIPLNIPDFKSLRLPAACKRIATLDRGLVLVTGATGNGKSTTIASILNFVASQRRKHIVTVEDPIEFTINGTASLVSQREVGDDVADFESGLWAALREDPDVVFIGEIRDVDTVRVALQAAETGHLIVSSIHTIDAQSTVDHVINMFPPSEQVSARLRLASCLQAVISQKLLPMLGRHQRVLATEVMLRSGGIQECIRKADGRRSLAERIARSVSDGMHTMDQDLRALFEAKLIDLETARAAATSGSDFVRNLAVTS